MAPVTKNSSSPTANAQSIAALFTSLATILMNQSENMCIAALQKVAPHHAAIPTAVIPPLVTAIASKLMKWHPKVRKSVAMLLLNICHHPAFNASHARAVIKAAETLLTSMVNRRMKRRGDIAQYAIYGNILARSITLVPLSVAEIEPLLVLIDHIAKLPSEGDRIVAIRLLEGLAKSSISQTICSREIFPRLRKMLAVGEDVLLADTVLAYAYALKWENRFFKHRLISDHLCALWFDSGLDELRDKCHAIMALCKTFGNELNVQNLFNGTDQSAKTMLFELCYLAAQQTKAMETQPVQTGLEFLQCIAQEMPALVKFILASEDMELIRNGAAMFQKLTRCNDENVAKTCASNNAALRQLEEAARKESGRKAQIPIMNCLHGLKARLAGWSKKVCGKLRR